MTTEQQTQYFANIDSPVGTLLLTASSRGLTGLFTPEQRTARKNAAHWIQAPERFAETRAQLDDYFAGRRKEFHLPLDLAGTIEASNPDLSADRPTPGLVLFDVRAAPDHRVGHLPGAVSLPAQFCSERVSKEVPAPANGDRFSVPVAFYCYGRSCVRSRNCSTEAARAGFRNVLWFRGGVPEWQAAGLPLLRSERAGPARP